MKSVARRIESKALDAVFCLSYKMSTVAPVREKIKPQVNTQVKENIYAEVWFKAVEITLK